jgi:hypothetical protein
MKKTAMMSVKFVVVVSEVAKKNTHMMMSCTCHFGCGNGENEKKP